MKAVRSLPDPRAGPEGCAIVWTRCRHDRSTSAGDAHAKPMEELMDNVISNVKESAKDSGVPETTADGIGRAAEALVKSAFAVVRTVGGEATASLGAALDARDALQRLRGRSLER
jgi:hypothetical protein